LGNDKILLNEQSVRAVRSTTTHWQKVDFGFLHETDFGGEIFVGTRCRGFDVIMCNPPYLRAAAAAGRITNERSGALYAGPDGLDAYRTLADSLGRCHRGLLAKETDHDDGGVLLLQLPAYKNAAAAVGRIFKEANDNFCVRQVLPDDRGIDRCLVVSWRAPAP
jgi:methylase of polypeptide subunit release factors